MGRIFDDLEGRYWFDSEEPEPIVFQLNENNMIGHMHRETPWLDLVGIEDPRDEMWWRWYRSDYQDTAERLNSFNTMMGIAAEIGSLLIRTTAFEQTQSLWDNAHQLKEDEINDLLGNITDGEN